MGMHADFGHGIIMATSMAQLHMQVMTMVSNSCVLFQVRAAVLEAEC